MRKIKIYSTVGVSGTIDTNVRTLGELKPLLRERDIDYSGMKMLVGETRNELSVDDAVLPVEDFKLYLMPQKTKSGCTESALEALDEAEDSLNEALASVKEVRAELLSKSVQKAKSVSREDEEAMEDLRSLVNGGSGVRLTSSSRTNSWD